MITRKYYWLTLCHDVETYVTGCDICLALKTVRYKSYGNLQLLPVPIYQWKDLSMDFVTGLSISTNWKGNIYNLILAIIDQFIKIIYYKPVKVTIDAFNLAKIILDVVVQYCDLLNLIINN